MLGVLRIISENGPPFVYVFLLPFSLSSATLRFGRKRAALLFALTYVITLSAELWGTHFGLFGAHYSYVPSRWAPLPPNFVMLVVPCMWFMMMYPSYVMARRIVGQHAGRILPRILVAAIGGLCMTAWDTAMDPTAVAVGLWRWTSGTPAWSQVPIENYAAWFLGSSLVVAIFDAVLFPKSHQLDKDGIWPTLAYGAVALYYVAIGMFAVRMGALLGMGIPVVLALLRGGAKTQPVTKVLSFAPEWAGPPNPQDICQLERANFLRHPVKNHFVNALHIVVAHGERYMIANIRRVKNRLSTPLLREQTDWFVDQEAHHAAEHRRFSTQLHRLGYRLERLDRLCRWIGQTVLPRLLSPNLNMAVTVAIEHFTACVAEAVLFDGILHDLDSAARQMIEWHCYEELEHRAVAFDVFQDVCGSYAVRLLGIFIGVQLIALLTLYGMLGFLAQDGQLFRAAAWREGLRFFYLKPALVLKTWPKTMHLLRPRFHPSIGLILAPKMNAPDAYLQP